MMLDHLFLTWDNNLSVIVWPLALHHVEAVMSEKPGKQLQSTIMVPDTSARQMAHAAEKPCVHNVVVCRF